MENGELIAKLWELGWTLDWPFYSEVPTPKDELVRTRKREVQTLVHQLLKTCIIKDNFWKNHIARREFERKNPEINEFNSQYSKLGGNKLWTCFLWMKDILNSIKNNKELYESLISIVNLEEIQDKLSKYNDMLFDEKVAFAKEMDEIIFKFLSALSE